MRTIKYEWFDIEGEQFTGTFKVPLTATHSDIHNMIYNRLVDFLELTWEEVEE